MTATKRSPDDRPMASYTVKEFYYENKVNYS